MINYPQNPNVGDEFDTGTVTFMWDGVKWKAVTVGGRTIISYANTESMQNSRPTQTGQRAENRERDNAQYELAASGYTALPGDVVAANGRVWQLVGGSYNQTLTVNIPSDHASLQSAIDYYHNKVLFTEGNELVINIESGHQPTTGISISNGDYSYIRITSDDAEVVLSPSFDGGLNSSVIYAEYAEAPRLACLININGVNVFNAYNVTSCSEGYVESGCGMKNGTRGMHVENVSSAYIDGAIFTGFQEAGLHCSRNSEAQCTDADLSGNCVSGSAFGSVYASRSSRIHGADVDASGSGGVAVRSQRFSEITFPGVDVSHASDGGFVATLGGRIYSSSSSPTMLNLGGPAVICQDGGLFSSDSFTATFSSAITDPAIEVRGGNVVMRNSSISGHAGIGLFAKGGGSIVECSGFSITGGSNGIRSEQGATVDASDSTIDSVTNNGVFALRGSKVVLEGASVTNSGSNDLAISEGGQIIISNGATTSGSPSASDTNVSAFNAIDGNKGIIWS